MAKNEIKSEINTNYLRRYPANYEFDNGTGFHAQIVPPMKKIRNHPSITDKESYRLQLASIRGAMSSLTPERQKGMYSFKDGVYDYHKDISFLLRKDLSIVEIDEYIQRTRERIESMDSDCSADLKSQLQAAEAKKAELEALEKSNSNSSKSQSSKSAE